MINYFRQVKGEEGNLKTQMVECFVCLTPIKVIHSGDDNLKDTIICCDCVDYAKDHYSW